MGPDTEPHHSHHNWELEVSVSAIPPWSLSFELTAGLTIWEISSSAGVPQALPCHPLLPWWPRESQPSWREGRVSVPGWEREWKSWSPAPLESKWSWVETQERHLHPDLFKRMETMDKNVKKKWVSCLTHKQMGRVPEEWGYLLTKASWWFGRLESTLGTESWHPCH